MENAEEIFHYLEDFSKRKPKIIPQELNDYLAYVARTGDPVYQWSLVKSLFKEKLLNVITDFYEASPSIEIPPYPNVDTFNYDIMKNSLLERLDSFTSAPFTVQRICELLTCPRKQYNRVDKFMRAVEKNILVVSTREPGIQRHAEPENDPIEPIVNGSDSNSDYNVDVEMEDMSWKENSGHQNASEPQPSSSDSHISINEVHARLQAKEEPGDAQDKTVTQYESVTPPELNVTPEQVKDSDRLVNDGKDESATEHQEVKPQESPSEVVKTDVEMNNDLTKDVNIPEIKVDDVEMTEQRLAEEAKIVDKTENVVVAETQPTVEKPVKETTPEPSNDSNSDFSVKEDVEPKIISDISSSSEESSSSSDNTDFNSNSPKPDTEGSQQEDSNEPVALQERPKDEPRKETEIVEELIQEEKEIPPKIEAENYSISDLNSELPQPPAEPCTTEENQPEPEQPAQEIVQKQPDVGKETKAEKETKVEEIPANNTEEMLANNTKETVEN